MRLLNIPLLSNAAYNRWVRSATFCNQRLYVHSYLRFLAAVVHCAHAIMGPSGTIYQKLRHSTILSRWGSYPLRETVTTEAVQCFPIHSLPRAHIFKCV